MGEPAKRTLASITSSSRSRISFCTCSIYWEGAHAAMRDEASARQGCPTSSSIRRVLFSSSAISAFASLI